MHIIHFRPSQQSLNSFKKLPYTQQGSCYTIHRSITNLPCPVPDTPSVPNQSTLHPPFLNSYCVTFGKKVSSIHKHTELPIQTEGTTYKNISPLSKLTSSCHTTSFLFHSTSVVRLKIRLHYNEPASLVNMSANSSSSSCIAGLRR